MWEVKELGPGSTGLNQSFTQLSLNDKTPRILKMQWAHEARETTEADFLRDIKNIPGVPKLIAEHRGPKTKDFVNPNLDIERIPLEGTRGRASSASGGSSYRTTDSTSNDIQAQSTMPPRLSGGNSSREQRWILISYCGASIDDTSDEIISSKPFTTIQRIRALRSIIHVIRDLFCHEKRIVHRDISANNVRIAPPPGASDSKEPIGSEDSADGEHPAGYLIDFDMASYWDTEGSGAKSRTGTPLYMAVNVLMASNLSCHLPWYDIESVFWVLLIGEVKRSGELPKEIQAPANLESLGSYKRHWVGKENTWLDLKKRRIIRGPVGELLCQLRGFLFDYAWEPTNVRDKIKQQWTYDAERFGTDGDAENIENALKEGVKTIDAWFEECIKKLKAE